MINEKKIQVEIDFADRLVVNGDSDQIFQVIYNLVDNAVKLRGERQTVPLHPQRGQPRPFRHFQHGQYHPV